MGLVEQDAKRSGPDNWPGTRYDSGITNMARRSRNASSLFGMGPARFGPLPPSNNTRHAIAHTRIRTPGPGGSLPGLCCSARDDERDYEAPDQWLNARRRGWKGERLEAMKRGHLNA